jgi:hypothetical protein
VDASGALILAVAVLFDVTMIAAPGPCTAPEIEAWSVSCDFA